MFSYGLRHMAEQKQTDQLEPTYNSSVRIQDVALRTCQKRWTMGRSGERGSGISVLAARHDDDGSKKFDEFMMKVDVQRFAYKKPSSGLWIHKKCGWNNDRCLKHLACLATLKCCDITKQSVCGLYNIYKEKLKKQNTPKFDEFIKKVDVEHYGCNNLLLDFIFMKNVIKIAMNVWWINRRKEIVYKKKDS